MEKKDKNKLFISNLFKFLVEPLKENKEELDEEITEIGYNVKEFENDIDNFIKDLNVQYNIEKGKYEAKNRKTKLEILINSLQDKNIDDIISKILPKSEYEQLSFQFRNLGEVNESEKISLMNDIQIIALLDYLENEKKEKN